MLHQLIGVVYTFGHCFGSDHFLNSNLTKLFEDMKYDIKTIVESVHEYIREKSFSPDNLRRFESEVDTYIRLLKPDFVTLATPKHEDVFLYEKNFGLDFGGKPEKAKTLIESVLDDQLELIHKLDMRTFQFLVEDADASVEKSFELRCNIELVPGDVRTIIRRGIVLSVDDMGVPEIGLICVNDVTAHSQNRLVAFDVRSHNVRTKADQLRLRTFKQEIQTILNSYMVDLTNRELQILQAIAQGQTSKSIAKNLNIAKSTVDTHRQNMIRKFDAPNMTALIQIAKSQGYI